MGRGFSDGFLKAKKNGKDSLSFSDKAKLIASNLKTGVSILLDGQVINGSVVPMVPIAGAFVHETNNTDVSTTLNTDTIAKTFTVNVSGTIRINWTHYSQDSTTMWSSIYKNGSPLTGDYPNASTASQSYDATVSAGDVITIRHRVSTPTGGRISHITNTSVALNAQKMVSAIS